MPENAHICRCDDGSVEICWCDSTKDHDEHHFDWSEGVAVDGPIYIEDADGDPMVWTDF